MKKTKRIEIVAGCILLAVAGYMLVKWKDRTGWSSSIGYGFTVVHFLEPLDRKQLYLGERNLGVVQEYSVSPSGRYILFSGMCGLMEVFDRNTAHLQQARPLRDMTRLQQVTWNEEAQTVDVAGNSVSLSL